MRASVKATEVKNGVKERRDKRETKYKGRGSTLLSPAQLLSVALNCPDPASLKRKRDEDCLTAHAAHDVTISQQGVLAQFFPSWNNSFQL